MTDELRAFRSELATAPPQAQARARRRLEARIAAGVSQARPAGGLRARRRAAALVLAGAVAGSGALVAVTAALWGTLGSAHESHVEAQGGAGAAALWRSRGGQPDGLLAVLPSLEGKDAGMRPTFDRGGWSECGTSECYLQS